MLEQIREFGNRKIVRLLFALFLVIPFGLFGIDYYFRAPVGGDTIASIGSQKIGQAEFDNAIRRQADNYRQQFGANFDAKLMDNPEMRRGVLERLLSEKAMLQGSHEAGVRIGDKLLAERIAAMAPFHDEKGQFSRERYEQLAKANGFTPVGLDERIREDIRLSAFREAVSDTAIVPRATLDGFIRLSEQSREVSVFNFAPEPMLPKVNVPAERVKAYFDEHKADFTIPEQARVEYIELSVDSLTAQIAVPADEVKRFYDANLGRWGQPETRKASHILLTVKPDAPEAERNAAKARAQEIADRVRKKPATFAETARKESQDPGSAPAGGDLGFFGRGQMLKPFEEAVYKAKKGEIVGPVQTDFGFHVIEVSDVRPEKMKSLADATPEIEADLKKSGAARRFAEVAETFSNIVYEQPASLKPAADLLKLTVQSSPWIMKAGAPIPALSNPNLLAEIFSDDAVKGKRNTSAVEVRPNVIVSARVVEHKPAELRPFESVQADILRRLQREEALKLAQAEGEAKLKDLQAGKDAGIPWPAVLAVNRQKPGGLFPQVMDQVFRVDGKKLPAFLGVQTPAGYALVRVSRIIELEKIDDAKREALGTQLRAAVAAQELESTVSSIRTRLGVSVKKDAVEKKEDPTAAPAQPTVPQRKGPPGKGGLS